MVIQTAYAPSYLRCEGSRPARVVEGEEAMTLVLRYGDPDAADHPHHARYANIALGSPGRCPECETFGRIDHEDLLGRWQNQHCPRCGTRWEYRFDEDGAIAEVVGLDVDARADVVLDLRAPDAAGAKTHR